MKLNTAAGLLTQSLPAFSNNVGHHVQIDDSKIHSTRKLDALRLHNGGGTPRNQVSLKQKFTSSKVKYNQIKLSSVDKQKGKLEPTPCDPSSQDPDIGILSCGKGSNCELNDDSLIGGVCASTRPSLQSKSRRLPIYGGLRGKIRRTASSSAMGSRECDPSVNANVGILSCGVGQECVESARSSLGGFCTSIVDSRQLALFLDNASVCDPSSELYMYYDCDCSGFDQTSGTGTVPCTAVENYCLGLVYSGCSGTCITRTVEYTFANFAAPSYTFCYQSTTPYTQNVCFTNFFDSSACQAEFNGVACNSCTVDNSGLRPSLDVDCTNVGGGIGAELSAALPVIAKCYDPIANPIECSLCPGEYTVFDPSLFDVQVDITGFGTYSCYALVEGAYYFGFFSETSCPIISSAAASSCCSTYCKLCGPYSYVPVESNGLQLSTTIEGFQVTTCGDLAYAAYNALTLPDGACSTLSTSLKQTCCYAEPTISPMSGATQVIPTTAPVNTPATITSTTAPVSTSRPVAPTSTAATAAPVVAPTTPPITETLVPAPTVSPITETLVPAPTVSPITETSVPAPTVSPVIATLVPTPSTSSISTTWVPTPTRAPIMLSSEPTSAAPQIPSISITGTLAPILFTSTKESVSELPTDMPVSSTSGTETEPAATLGAGTSPVISRMGHLLVFGAAADTVFLLAS